MEDVTEQRQVRGVQCVSFNSFAGNSAIFCHTCYAMATSFYKPLMFLQPATHCSEEKVFSLSNLRELFTKNVSLQCRNTFLMTWPYCVQSLASPAKEFNNIVYYGGCSVIKEMDYGHWQLYNCHLKFKQYVVQTLKQFGYLWFIIHSLLKCHWNVIHCNH